MKRILTLIFIITLSGCSQFHTSAPQRSEPYSDVTWEIHQKNIEQLSTWSLTGKLAIFAGKERQSANLYWQQTGENYSIQLTSFIGTRILQIKKDNEGVEIINDDGDKFVGQDANTLIRKLSPELDLPISSLQQWIKGNPVDASYQLNEQQRVSDLLGKDKGNGIWAVNFSQYQPSANFILPSQLELTQDHIRVKIAINQWNIPTQ